MVIHIVFVELRSRLHELVVSYGLLDTLDEAHFYDSIDARSRSSQ